jgi:hypothetical protein|tara:strand:+ start:574 stop:858 length:285 start_codon:yes stop_codon:yes gene_type:complete
MDLNYLQKALGKFNIGKHQWYGWKKDWTGEKRMTYENLILNDNSATMPTQAEVNAKIEELKQAEANKETTKASAKQKLQDLGLTVDEIKEAFGI